MYKVFVNDKSIQLVKNINKKNITNQDKVLNYVEIKSLSHEIKEFTSRTNYKNLFIIHSTSVEKLFDNFLLNFTLVEAAGGLVINEKKEILFIFRKGKWDLPKGKVEASETLNSTAIREVKEETGIKGVRITGNSHHTYHVYELKGKQVLKKTYWYHMFCSSKQHFIPQKKEEITDVKWFRADAIDQVIRNTYRSIHELLVISGLI